MGRFEKSQTAVRTSAHATPLSPNGISFWRLPKSGGVRLFQFRAIRYVPFGTVPRRDVLPHLGCQARRREVGVLVLVMLAIDPTTTLDAL